MKLESYIAADNIISPLGFTSAENFEQVKKMQTGIQFLEHSPISNEPIFAAMIDSEKLNDEFQKLKPKQEFTRFEKLVILSITDALKQNKAIDISDKKTLLILSSTKGNIDLLSPENKNKFDKKRLYLWETAKVIARHFDNPNTPVVVSNACISGILAIITAKRLLEENQYDTIIVSGADILTQFVVSGFQSFKAMGTTICKPYDASRDGISLGEGCGTIVLTNNKSIVHNVPFGSAQGTDSGSVQGTDSGIPNNNVPFGSAQGTDLIIVSGGSSSNDANHISGPSRTGDGLLLAINKTLNESGMKPDEIDFISGHGTATSFNDEMEALAITDAHLSNVPMNSLKGYFGHTLGAAGIIESIIGIHSMREDILIGTYNFNEIGVSKSIHIIRKTQEAKVNNCLKIGAGFGGCNAAVLFSKR